MKYFGCPHYDYNNHDNGSDHNLYMTMPYIRTAMIVYAYILGYEPADLTVHPPPQNNREWVHFFRIGV